MLSIDWIGHDLRNLLLLPNQQLYSLYEQYYSAPTRKRRQETIRRIANTKRYKFRLGSLNMPPEEYPFEKAQEPQRIKDRLEASLGKGALDDSHVHLEYVPVPEPEPEIDPNVELAMSLLSQKNPELETLKEIHEDNPDWVREVELEVKKDSVNILHLNELLLGHKDSAYDFFALVSESLDTLKPDAIVMSGLMQGDFRNLEKRRRQSLRPQLASMDTQFHFGKQILDTLVETKIPVIYNMGNDDHRIAEEYTIEVFKKMLGFTKGSPTYYQIDQMKTHPRWHDHLNFQIDYAFPYCLRNGRRLRSSAELKEEMGEDAIEEYMMLYDTIKKIERGEDPNPDFVPHLNMEALGDTDFTICDDLNLNIKTKGAKHTDSIRHYMNFSSQPMYGNHMLGPTARIGEMKSQGEPTPDMLVLQHNMEEVGVCVDGTWVVSIGPLFRAKNFFNSKGSRTDVQGDQSRRLNTTRRRVPSPSASAHERFDDGRYLVTIYNEALMNKSKSCERTLIVAPSDFQIASLTARPDLLVKFLDYIQSSPEQALVAFNGDFIQGRNYPGFPNENQSIGLIRIESQIEFTAKLIEQALRSNDSNIIKAIVQPGNHEWNSAEVWHGDSFTRYLRDILKDKDIPVKFGEGMQTNKGEFFKTWASVEYVGDYGVYVAHQPLKKGAKGNTGLPIYQAHAHSVGVGEAKKSIDIELYGHWHHPQYALFGDKLAVITGSIAGMSGYEWDRGYRPVISGALLHIGGGLPPQLEFLSEEMLHGYKIAEGPYSNKALKKAGYQTDKDFDATKHGLYTPGPKSALQKYILQMIRDASVGEISELK